MSFALDVQVGREPGPPGAIVIPISSPAPCRFLPPTTLAIAEFFARIASREKRGTEASVPHLALIREGCQGVVRDHAKKSRGVRGVGLGFDYGSDRAKT